MNLKGENKYIVSERLHYLDIAKGLLVILVIVSHFSVMLGGLNLEERHFAGVYYFIPLFRTSYMQCFFFISGYCSNFQSNGKTFLYKLLRLSLLPALFFGLIGGIHTCWHEGKDSFSLMSFWFLNALIFSKIVCWFLSKHVKKEWFSYVIVTSLLLIGILLHQYGIGDDKVYINQCLVSCFFVYLGTSIRRHQKWNSILMRYTWIAFIVFWLSTYCLNLAFSVPAITGYFMDFELYESFLLIIVPILGIFTILSICKQIGRNSFFEYFGQNSLVVYCLHALPFPYIMKFLVGIFVPTNLIAGTIFYMTSISIEVIIMVGVAKLFKYAPLKYGLGKW
ncbi:MAG: acyltransferase [Prevotella sp.]|nr:acyltransferase [Prevotella sp.]